MEKVKHLIELPRADTNLKLWKADMNVEGSYDEAVKGCEGVFHMATPMDFESDDPEVCCYSDILLLSILSVSICFLSCML